MKKMNCKKGISLVLSAAMAVTALPLAFVSASAESANIRGDVDMDGIITGHDSALVSHYLYVDADSLSDEQLALADMNEDGTVDQTDADLIHEQEAYAIGDVNLDGEVDVNDAMTILVYYAKTASGTSVEEQSEKYAEILEAGENQPDYQLYYNLLRGMAFVSEYETLDEDEIAFYTDSISTVCYNLMDVNADGEVNLLDPDRTLSAYVLTMCGWDFYYTSYGSDVTRYDLASTEGHPGFGEPDF